MTYSEKLRDPRWQKRRLEIMERDGWSCKSCGDKETMLSVHHLVYSGQPWDAPDDALETLREECHTFREEWNSLFGRSKRPTMICKGIKDFLLKPIFDEKCHYRSKKAIDVSIKWLTTWSNELPDPKN